LDTIFAAFRRPALSGCWAASHSYPEFATNEFATGALQKDASCQPLQPTSVVTSTRWIPNSQACGLRRSARRDLPNAPTNACARVTTPNCPRRRRIAVAGISDLGWQRSLTLRPPVVATFTVPRRAPGCPSFDPRWHCGPNASPMRRPPTPPVTALIPSSCLSGSKVARTCFPSTSPKVLVPQIQSAFRRQVLPNPTRRISSGHCPSGRH
jgi:hypothetical protein